MAGLCAPLSTLRQYPHGHLRMTRGRCGSLLLHRDGLAPSTPCRSPGALRSYSNIDQILRRSEMTLCAIHVLRCTAKKQRALCRLRRTILWHSRAVEEPPTASLADMAAR